LATHQTAGCCAAVMRRLTHGGETQIEVGMSDGSDALFHSPTHDSHRADFDEASWSYIEEKIH
jgi:hypothetical protein